eukprot:3240710-Amphidinium_carterae.2
MEIDSVDPACEHLLSTCCSPSQAHTNHVRRVLARFRTDEEDLYPPELQEEIEEVNAVIYPGVQASARRSHWAPLSISAM